MNSSLLIIDAVATAPYTPRTLERAGLGGTEATAVRVAAELAKTQTVTFAQRARKQSEWVDGIRFVPYDHKQRTCEQRFSHIVVIRAHKLLPRLRRRHPDARMFLWMHCFLGRRLRPLARVAHKTETTIVGVSLHHQRMMQAFFERHDALAARRAEFRFVYNPIDDQLRPDGTAVDPNKLLFLSSPHKGLPEVIDNFRWLKERVPELKLYVANPGYLDWKVSSCEGVVWLGSLPHHEALQHLRSALCLFYPQSTFAETFGLVLAEANAVGTHVLAHPIGAASEIVADSDQVFDTRDRAAILERILRWQRGQGQRPTLRGALRRSSVLQAWQGLLMSNYKMKEPGRRVGKEATAFRPRVAPYG